jgi:hypothetical protein
MVTLEDLAWQALGKALEDVTVPCAGDPLFTMDSPTKDAQEFMASLCAACPVLELCGTYAATAKPAAGFWAGKLRGKPRAKTTSTTADRTVSGTHHE